MDGLLVWLLFHRVQTLNPKDTVFVMVSFALWLVFAKTVKLLPHLYRYPTDVRFIPVAIIFGYLHGLIKIYALFTLNVVSLHQPSRLSVLCSRSIDVLGRAGYRTD